MNKVYQTLVNSQKLKTIDRIMDNGGSLVPGSSFPNGRDERKGRKIQSSL
jgi:hypothetical protein